MTDLKELTTPELCERLLSKTGGYHPSDDDIREAARRLRALTEWKPANHEPAISDWYLVVVDAGKHGLCVRSNFYHIEGGWEYVGGPVIKWRELPQWEDKP